MRRKSSMKPRLQKVRFDLYAPEAQKVSLVGDFTGWDFETLPLKKGRQSTWNAYVDLPPGRKDLSLTGPMGLSPPIPLAIASSPIIV